jgi:hypothetical protein
MLNQGLNCPAPNIVNKRKEVRNMIYEKPKILISGTALLSILSQIKVPDDNPDAPEGAFTMSAYEADE